MISVTQLTVTEVIARTVGEKEALFFCQCYEGRAQYTLARSAGDTLRRMFGFL